MTYTPEAESAPTRRSARPLAAPAEAGRPLTRAELRRRAQAAVAPETSTDAATAAPEEAADLATLPELAPEALVLPAAARRVRARPATPVAEAPEVSELYVPAEDADEPVAQETLLHLPSQEELDEFEAAARLFAFTGETPIQVAATARASEDDADAASQHPLTHAPRHRRFTLRRVATASFSIGVFGVVGLLAVGMTTPVSAVAAAQGTDAAAKTTNILAGSDVSADPDEIQAYVAPADVQSGTIERTDDYETMSLAQIAADSGIQNFSSFFTNDPTAPIQWPFAVGVPITYGFGMRSGTMHEGVDFVPGAGAPVQAIADGTVRIATESGGAFGVTVLIDHVIDGELVSSRYGHMQYGSLRVKPGDHVTVGTVIGKTGNTGRSFGAHTHVEILAGGTTPIDPIPWLRAHAGG
ncbi:M23 family metallopeptidase [Microbacterium sp. P05]|uniref:M23 family metallopeptidase n=1 Tax=Microbacterium sp. P05 TaxID=3366948 RepID=UPI003745E334